MNVPTDHLLALAAVLFALGVLGFLVRKNVIIVLASIELMLNAANLSFLAASRHWSQTTLAGQGDPQAGPVFGTRMTAAAGAPAERERAAAAAFGVDLQRFPPPRAVSSELPRISPALRRS